MPVILDKILEEYGNQEKCKIRDPEKVESILQQLVQDGPNKLQVISDFDFTLSRFHLDGEKCDSCYGIVDASPLMPTEYRQQADDLFRKYYNIEIDHTISVEEKIPHMVAWYKQSQNLIVQNEVTKTMISEMVKSSRALLRDSAVNVLSLLNDHKVPVLIFSAGVGNILEEVLEREKAFFPNVQVVSNYMVFNENGKCTSFKEPLIHMFNKDETAVPKNTEYFHELSHRPNAFVLGDSVGDLSMSNGIPNAGAVLKIGFLNDKINERMDSFIDGFDVVLVDDQSFKFVNTILQKIVHT